MSGKIKLKSKEYYYIMKLTLPNGRSCSYHMNYRGLPGKEIKEIVNWWEKTYGYEKEAEKWHKW